MGTSIIEHFGGINYKGFQKTSNFLLAVIFCIAVAYLIQQYAETGQFSIILNIIFYGTSVICALVRRTARDLDVRFFSWLFTLAGTTLPMLLLPIKTNEFLVGHVLQISGIAISIFGLISLKRSFGLVAANRGIVSSGLYRLVRHPLYASYELSIIGFIVNNLNIYNVFVLCVHLACQIHRISREEGLLSKDPEYLAYRSQTKWRLFPYVF